MAKPAAPDRQTEKDRRQIRQHFVHWGVKTVTMLVVAAIVGAIWLGWTAITGSSR